MVCTKLQYYYLDRTLQQYFSQVSARMFLQIMLIFAESWGKNPPEQKS